MSENDKEIERLKNMAGSIRITQLMSSNGAYVRKQIKNAVAEQDLSLDDVYAIVDESIGLEGKLLNRNTGNKGELGLVIEDNKVMAYLIDRNILSEKCANKIVMRAGFKTKNIQEFVDGYKVNNLIKIYAENILKK